MRYISSLQDWAEQAARVPGSKVEVVANAQDACLLIVGENAAAEGDFREAPSWNSGKNHIVWWANTGFPAVRGHVAGHGDWMSPNTFAYAALAASVFTPLTFRSGYDVGLALPPKQNPPPEAALRSDPSEIAAALRRKQYLVTFRGKYTLEIFPWEQHRYVASEYLHDPKNGVVIDVYCPPTNDSYSQKADMRGLLLNSTFAFTPGGGGPHSYRFAEALSFGTIPVVTTDLILPFEPDVDWGGCVVRVSERSLVVMHHILRRIDDAEVLARQRECARLFHMVLTPTAHITAQPRVQPRELDADKAQFMLMLEVFARRVHGARHRLKWASGAKRE